MASQPNMLALILLMLASLTCLCISLPSEYSIVEHDLDAFLSEERVFEMFQQWKEKHRKMYRRAEEAARRFEMFKGNLKYILERNAKEKSTKVEHYVGLNKFADMNNEEFRKTYLSKVKNPIKKRIARSRNARKVQSCDAPSSLDWSNYGIVTGVKDQGSCGSCWAFSSTGAIEGINALVTGDLVSISEQELVDCDSSNYGCEGGYMDYAFEWVINNGGIDTESDYPYTGVDGTCNTTKEEANVVSIDGYQDVEETDSALLCAVVQQPVSVGIDASSIDFQLYTGGIYDGSCSNNPDDIDHAVLIVGYGSKDSKKYWIVKNSWGTSWGINGYFYLKRDSDVPYGVCAVNAMASYPTKESSSLSPYPSPSVPPPPPPATPPPPPSPSTCGDFSYCQSDETCCCLLEFYDYCLIYSCCAYENAVCCTGTEYCCPSDYPICDVQEGLCLKNVGDNLGVAAKKRKLAKHKLPWTKIEQTEKTYQTLQWKRNPFAAMH